MNIKRILAKNYINLRGWKTNRKIVVIESDDWGSIRMRSNEAVNKLNRLAPKYLKSEFAQFDGLERTDDLELLFELLSEFKDNKGNNPVVTALSLTSNPNFEQIEKTNYSYQSESILETYKKYEENKLFDLWLNTGVKQNLLYPQFHGKEHLHPERYILRIRDKKDLEHLAYKEKSIVGTSSNFREKNFMAACEYQCDRDRINIENRIEEGLQMFKEIFGFSSKSFCPSQSIYGEHIYKVLKENGVIAIQAGQQFRPEKNELKKVNNFWGEKTNNGLFFWRRNCTFEPYKSLNTDHVNECLKEIEIAFRWGKPAVINSHRINYTSRISPKIRDKTLKGLEKLLKKIIVKWPEVEFVNSEQLGSIIIESL